jgi:hypothetical protein
VVASKHTPEQRDGLKMWLLWCIAEQGMPAAIACREVGITYMDCMNWTRSDPVFEQAYKEAMDTCYQKMADRLLTLHEEGHDPKTAKNIADNIRWWLSRRKPGEFGDKLVVQDERPDLVRILQAGIERLIDVAAQQPLKVIEVEAKPVTRIRRFSEADPEERHRP